jgi:hypothetical protein
MPPSSRNLLERGAPAGQLQRCFQWGSLCVDASSARPESRRRRAAHRGPWSGNRQLSCIDLVVFDKGFPGRNGILLGLGHPDFLQHALGLGVQALRHLVQDVRGLVHPAALLAGCRPHLAERLPEPERAVGDRNLRRRCQAATLRAGLERKTYLGQGSIRDGSALVSPASLPGFDHPTGGLALPALYAQLPTRSICLRARNA